MKKPSRITFEAVYEDGHREFFDVPADVLRSGDHVKHILAGERQRKGELSAGKIIEVHRSNRG